MSWRVGIDTGGTFTDLVAARGGELRVAKVPSTPPSFERGVFDAIEAAGIAIPEIAVLAHGTTVATNAFLTREEWKPRCSRRRASATCSSAAVKDCGKL